MPIDPKFTPGPNDPPAWHRLAARVRTPPAVVVCTGPGPEHPAGSRGLCGDCENHRAGRFTAADLLSAFQCGLENATQDPGLESSCTLNDEEILNRLRGWGVAC